MISSVFDFVLKRLNLRVPGSIWRKSVENLSEVDVDSSGNISTVYIHCVATGKKTRKSTDVCVSLSSGKCLQFRKE